MTTETHRWAQPAWVVLAALYLAFIGVASFYLTAPLPDPQQALERLFSVTLRSARLNLHNAGDIATNIVLYLPLGILVCFARSVRRRPPMWSVFVLLGFGISLIVEVAQAFVGRYSDLLDVLSNGTGFALGYLIAWWSVHRLGLQPARLLGWSDDNHDARYETLIGLRFAYVVIALIAALVPFDLTISPGEILGKLSTSPPKLQLDPWFHFRNGFAQLHGVLLKALVVLPFAALSTLIVQQRNQFVPLLVARNCLLFVVTLELCKLFVRAASSDIFIALLAPLIGGLVAILLTREKKSPLGRAQASNWLSAAIGYGVFLALMAWSPYRFEIAFGDIISKLVHDTNWIPFRLHFSSRTMASALDLIKEVGLYLPLGALLMQWLRLIPVTAVTTRALLVGAVGLIVAATLELSQLLVAERYVDITDPLLATLGTAIGASLNPLLLGTRGHTISR